MGALRHPRAGGWASLGQAALCLLLLVSAACAPAARSGQGQPYDGVALEGQAPDFALVDQMGTPRRLSDFRGQVVVLTFLDSRCQDVCPRLAEDLRQLYAALAEQAQQVALVGVNVNAQASTVSDIYQASARWHLDTIPTWHYLTGEPAALAEVWSAYAIGVTEDEQTPAALTHTAGVYLIDRTGAWRWYVSSPPQPAGEAQPAATLSGLLLGHIQALLLEARAAGPDSAAQSSP